MGHNLSGHTPDRTILSMIQAMPGHLKFDWAVSVLKIKPKSKTILSLNNFPKCRGGFFRLPKFELNKDLIM